MKIWPSIGVAFMATAVVVVSATAMSGCDSGGDKTVVAVDPQFQKKTSEMLKQIKAEAIEKYKKPGGRKP
jgi:hypothetical protein